MLTQAQVMEAVTGGRKSECLDGRDYLRLTAFFPVSDWAALGFRLDPGAENPEPRPWTEQGIKEQLATDLDFAFEKALGRRGISAGFMHSVIRMWMWILEDDLQNMHDYAQYGLPLLKAVADKYELPNEIGDDAGDEHCYSADGDDG